MVTRVVTSEREKNELLTLLSRRDPPFTVSIAKGKVRTDRQNRLQRMWCGEIAEQLGDRTAEEVRGYCKLHMGVPILRAENEYFREQYDAVVKDLPYERKLAFMQEPLDLPVTRMMSTEQKTRYLDEIHRHFSEQGVRLTDPESVR